MEDPSTGEPTLTQGYISPAANPASAAGIAFQFERALLAFVGAAADASIGIETLDDVSALEASTGNILFVEQDKHSISPQGYPLNDRSPALWKTLKNWLHIENSGLNVAAYLFVTNTPVRGGLLRLLGKANKTEEEVLGLLGKVREIS